MLVDFGHLSGWGVKEQNPASWAGLADESSHQDLWDCYLSGQLSERQLYAHLNEDSSFRSYVDSQRAKRCAQ